MNARFFALALPLIATTIARADEHDADRHPADLPAALAVGDDKTLSIVVVGVGVQIYDCKDAGGGAYAWVFRAPEATLYSANGQVGTHYVGPTWEWQNGSTVVGAVAARVNSPDPNAIPWLRLTAVAHEGHGPLARVSTILRRAPALQR